MFRIDTSRAVLARPASAAPGTPGYFTNGDPATGYLPTQLDGEWFNGVQENLAAALADGGISPVKGPSGDNNLRDAIRAIIDGKTRTVLTNHLNLYVATTGNDANPGTAGSPFLTIQGAINYIYRELDLGGGYGVYINLAAGTYSGAVYVWGPPAGRPAWWGVPITIVGDPAAPSARHITLADNTQNLITVGGGAGLLIQGVKLSHTGTPGGLPNLFFVVTGGWGVVDRCEFGAAPSSQLYCHQARLETLPVDSPRTSAAAYTISGSARSHAAAVDGAWLCIHGSTITITGTPAFSDFVESHTAGRLEAGSVTFVGGCTGQRYYAGPGGFILTGGGGANYFPGSVAGGIDPLGFYW